MKVGEKVKVQILSVDTERRRIGLSLRRLTPQPWEVIDTTYEVGQVVRGRITKLVNFGAFARLVDTRHRGADPHQRALRAPGRTIPKR